MAKIVHSDENGSWLPVREGVSNILVWQTGRKLFEEKPFQTRALAVTLILFGSAHLLLRVIILDNSYNHSSLRYHTNDNLKTSFLPYSVADSQKWTSISLHDGNAQIPNHTLTSLHNSSAWPITLLHKLKTSTKMYALNKIWIPSYIRSSSVTHVGIRRLFQEHSTNQEYGLEETPV